MPWDSVILVYGTTYPANTKLKVSHINKRVHADYNGTYFYPKNNNSTKGIKQSKSKRINGTNYPSNKITYDVCMTYILLTSALLSSRSVPDVASLWNSDSNCRINTSLLCQRWQQNGTETFRGSLYQGPNFGAASWRNLSPQISGRTQTRAQASRCRPDRGSSAFSSRINLLDTNPRSYQKHKHKHKAGFSVEAHIGELTSKTLYCLI